MLKLVCVTHPLDETDPARFVECKTRRPSATSRGQISWIIEKVDFFTEGHLAFLFLNFSLTNK